MADATYGTKVYIKQGGEQLVVASGGTINVEAGGKIVVDGTQGAALTAQLTTITHTAPGTPDYALQNLVQNTGFGFATADEGNTLLSVVANLQARLAEVEARLEGAGIVIAN
jgi:L-ascorbate metabolism protein UlaG (beta-lactamase superfamily)